jgi:hypothetical protein
MEIRKFLAVSSLLNDTYCYFIHVGKWKELTPDDVIASKREKDSVLFANQPLFSNDLIQAYNEFTRTAFQAYGEWGKDAKLRTSVDHRKEAAKGRFEWNDEWDERFTEEDKRAELKAVYDKLISQFARDLGVQESAEFPGLGHDSAAAEWLGRAQRRMPLDNALESTTRQMENLKRLLGETDE